MKVKLGTVVAALVLLAAVPWAADARQVVEPPADEDLATALELERKIDDHLVWGQVVPVTYGDATRTPGDIANVHSWGDSGLWTGVYLASQSFRYAVAQQEMKSAPATEKKFWQEQRKEAKARIEVMVEKFRLLTRIARGWQTTFDPQFEGTDPEQWSFGGGVIKGEEGMLMRACAPTDAPPQLDMEPNKRVFGPFPWEDGKEYVCETAPSRDTYAGTTFGLMTAFDLVGKDDPELQRKIGADILKLGDFLVKHGWNYPRPHGNISTPATGGHDFDNFASPLFVYVPLARLNMTASAKHVADTVGTLEEKAKWNAVWAEELATQGPLAAGQMEVDAAEPNTSYYKFNLNHLTGYTPIRLATDPATRLLFKHAVGVMDRTTGDDLNAHFEAITYAITGEQWRYDAAQLHLDEWKQYRAKNDAGTPTFNEARCGVDIQCVPNDQWDAEIAGQEITTRPGTSGKRARYPLPVADRPPTDFLWQRPPTQLNGSTGAADEEVGHDYLLPYWMLRYHSEVAPTGDGPFPPYPGPAHQ